MTFISDDNYAATYPQRLRAHWVRVAEGIAIERHGRHLNEMPMEWIRAALEGDVRVDASGRACSACRFFAPMGGAMGECRRRPPRYARPRWPSVTRGDVCGEHEPRDA